MNMKKSSKNRKKSDAITTEIKAINDLEFYYAEDKHQQYLSKNPDGYCGLKGTGVVCPLPQREKKSNVTEKPENKDEL